MYVFPTAAAYSSLGRTSVIYATSLVSRGGKKREVSTEKRKGFTSFRRNFRYVLTPIYCPFDITQKDVFCLAFYFK